MNKSFPVLLLIYDIVGYAMQCWFVPIDTFKGNIYTTWWMTSIPVQSWVTCKALTSIIIQSHCIVFQCRLWSSFICSTCCLCVHVCAITGAFQFSPWAAMYLLACTNPCKHAMAQIAILNCLLCIQRQSALTLCTN